LQIDGARVGERLYADQVALQRPAERHCVVGVAEREILPRAVQRRGACHCGEPQDSVIGETVVWAVAEVRNGHSERIAHAVPIGVGEVPQVEQAVVDDAVVASGKLHEAGDEAVVDNHRIAGNSPIG
jgi:hypothetical protein